MEGENDVETKAEVEVGSSGGDEAGGVGDDTGEGGADKSAAYSSSPVLSRFHFFSTYLNLKPW